MTVLRYVLAGLFFLVLLAFMMLFFLSRRAEEERYWGFIDADGNTVVPTAYDDARDFSGGYAAVRKGNRWGFVDHDGEEVIPPTFQSVGDFSTAGNAWAETRDFQVGYIDATGRWVIQPRFHRGYSFSEGRAIAGIAVGRTSSRTSGSMGQSIYSYGLIGDDGAWLVAPVGDKDDPLRWSTGGVFSEGRCPVQLDGDRFGYIDRTGILVIPAMFSFASPFIGGRALAGLPAGGTRVIDPTGAALLDIPVDGVWIGEDGYLTIYGSLEDGEGAFLVAPDGSVLQGPYEEAKTYAGGRLPVQTGKGWILIDADGTTYGPHWDAIESVNGGMAAVRRNTGGFFSDKSLIGFIDVDGTIVIPPGYNRAGPFTEGRARVAERR